MTTSAKINLKLSRISVPEKINTFVVTAKGLRRKRSQSVSSFCFQRTKLEIVNLFLLCMLLIKNFIFGMLRNEFWRAKKKACSDEVFSSLFS